MKKKKNKISKAFLKARRALQKQQGFFDGRYRSKTQDTKKNYKRSRDKKGESGLDSP